MNIRNAILLLTVSAVAAVSCNLFKPLDMDIDVTVDKTAETSASKIIGIEKEKNLATDPSGNLIISYEAEKPVSKSITLSSTAQNIGVLEIAVDEKPSITNGAELSDGQILIEIDNPSDTPMLVKGDLNASATTKAVEKTGHFEFTVPAQKIGFRVLLRKAGAVIAERADLEVNMEPSVGDIMDGTTIVEKPLRISLDAMLPGTKAGAAPAAAAVTVKANAKALCGFSFKKNEGFKIVTTLSNLGLNLADYTVKSKKYDIIADVTNSMPFEITGTGESEQNIKATMANPIAAGTKAAPVKSSVTINVVDNSSNSVVEDAVITLQFKAASNGARLNVNEGFKALYKSIKVHQL